jgi:hypothetical protein
MRLKTANKQSDPQRANYTNKPQKNLLNRNVTHSFSDKAAANGNPFDPDGSQFTVNGSLFNPNGNPFNSHGSLFNLNGKPFDPNGTLFKPNGSPFAANRIPFNSNGNPFLEYSYTKTKQGVTKWQ